MGLLDRIFGRPKSSTAPKSEQLAALLEQGRKAQSAMTKAADTGSGARTANQAREAIPKIITILETEGGGHDMIQNLAGGLKSVIPLLSSLDDNSVIQQCQDIANKCRAGAQRMAEFHRKIGR